MLKSCHPAERKLRDCQRGELNVAFEAENEGGVSRVALVGGESSTFVSFTRDSGQFIPRGCVLGGTIQGGIFYVGLKLITSRV